ncbi:MAG: glycerol-3-phosphate dehydrogenase [Gammaproteobacteria bacterium]|jgi:glycerol-3-phosphate dehydrogenase (NAD(P)+)|nr:glycerol-3-phosphate dehydrogenase [Gammaproteobacteria bacterium]
MATQIAVLGAGSWGMALALLLARNQHAVSLWGHDTTHMQQVAQLRRNPKYFPDVAFPPTLEVKFDLATAVRDADHVLLVVPSHAFSATLEAIVPHLSEKAGVFWGTKGLDSDGRWLHEVAEQHLGKKHKLAILSGPSFAAEVIAEKPTAVTIAANDLSYGEILCQLFSNRYFRAYQSSDLIGVQLGGAVKNILAIAAGIVDGSNLGTNARSALITRGLAEMMRLGEAVGAQSTTLMGLAGVGDLVLTCTDNQSRNHRFGVLLGQGLTVKMALEQIGQVVEGVKTTERIQRLRTHHKVDMPITQCVHEVLQEKITVKEAVQQLMGRPLRFE